MAATSTTEVWDSAWTSTMRSKRKRLTDTVFDEYPFLAWLRKNALETENGGKEIQEDVMYGKNTGGWFNGYDEVNTDAVDGITAAFYPWRYLAVPITISMTEEMENRSTDKAIKMLEAKTKQSMMTIRDTMSAALFSAQSGSAILGLQDLVADAPTSGSVGGINRATETWWRSQVNATSTNVDALTNGIVDGLSAMSTLWNSCSEGNTTPKGIVTTLTAFGDLETVMESTGYARLNSGGGSAKIDASSINFRGANVFYDRDCPSGHMYMLNPNTIKLKIQKGLNFAKTPFKEPHNQFAKVAFIVVGAQFITNNPRRNGVATTLT
tara:strand:+ start:2106 stop:3077 length:972 start_codon:yes stop_codon:yes gene_type:complete